MRVRSTIGSAPAGATLIGAVPTRGGGRVTSGCVFFICTVGAVFGFGSGIMAMRAVSFFGPGEVDGFGIGVIAGMVAAALTLGGAGGGIGFDINGAVGVFDVRVAGGGGGGRNGNGSVAGEADIGDKGGGIAGASVKFGELACGRAATSLRGGRAGKLIRTVSRVALAPGPGGVGRGGNVMRTVSFFGSGESAMKRFAKHFKHGKNCPSLSLAKSARGRNSRRANRNRGCP